MNFKKILFILIIFNTIFLYAQNSKNILILNSYHKGFIYSDNIINGIESIYKDQENIKTNILYMDSRRVFVSDYKTLLSNFYKAKFENKKFDLIICIGKFSYDFVINNKLKVFNYSKIIYTGIENKKIDNPNIYTISANIDVKENVELIYTVMKKLKKLYIINSSLEKEKTNIEVEKALKKLKKRFEIQYIEHSSISQLKEKFSSHKKNEAILFIKFLEDSDFNSIKDTNIVNFIKSVNIPIFVVDDQFLKEGVVGGKIISSTKLGKTIAILSIDILNNKQHIKRDYKLKYDYKFDSLVLKKYNIKPYYFYNSYSIVNKPEDFFQKHRDLFEILFLLFPLLLLLVIGLLHNIYYRKQTEKLLQERIDFDDTLLNAMKNPIFWQNKDEKIVDFNSKFSSMIGISEDRLYYASLKKLRSYKKARKLLEALEKYNKNEKEALFTFETEDKTKKIYLINQAKFKDEKSQSYGTVTILTDITKEKQIEKEKERNQEFLIQQSKLAEIGEIFSAIAHQWKAPLLEITTIAQESFYSNEDDDKEKESYVKDIMTQVKYMNDTINDFQDFIKPSNKKTKFDIYEAITSLLKIIDHNIRFNYIDVKIDLKDNTNVTVYGYRNEFMQSLLNIINNAKDELVNNDFKNRKINIEIFNKQNKLYINIKDNAGGISTKNIESIFTPYYSTKKDGSGIGLYMTKVIIEDKMNGKIRVKNTKVGACFTIILEQGNENISTRG
ncbi:hypothetical protein CPU12_11910 [Malaciobacter molluscorum LMG 25693]|uniref:Two-component system sensor histidine kinase n=1 Tax=Malaciobacter molluscorum LMG 25693 TaxID=870501 RepID=A0A2G1DF50_9BACT|nr:ATP-binding protein [Malaciobacter molluscorum]AXX91296.1 two-component system sensor histidine kinase [Malaciobacter molluscorum LMG 25693]PHO17115.1 hypothetical protein CPU12_11910 [Malaciobacter molluscorum LMG 25693]